MGFITIQYCGTCGKVTKELAAQIRLTLSADGSTRQIWRKDICKKCLAEIEKAEKESNSILQEFEDGFEKRMREKLRQEFAKFISENKNKIIMDSTLLSLGIRLDKAFLEMAEEDYLKELETDDEKRKEALGIK